MKAATNEVVVHESPAWRDRANFIVVARLDPLLPDPTPKWEQLWTRQVAGDRFEVCCIPFFVYDLALGDEVETGAKEGKDYVVGRVVRTSGHYTFRAWFQEPEARKEVMEDIVRLGGLVEWRSSTGNLMAMDAATEDDAKAISGLLLHLESDGILQYETGRSR